MKTINELRRIAPMKKSFDCEVWWYANSFVGHRAIVGRCDYYKPGNYSFPTDIMELDTTYENPGLYNEHLSSFKKIKKLKRKELKRYRNMQFALHLLREESEIKILQMDLNKFEIIKEPKRFDGPNTYWHGEPKDDTLTILQT